MGIQSIRFAPQRVLLVLFGMLAGWGNSASLELEVKAAMLFNFTKFVDWPSKTFAAPNSPFVIVVAGSEPMKQVLESLLHEKNVNGHPIQVLKADSPSAIREAQIVFIGRSEKRRLGEFISASKGSHALTVSEVEGFARNGGIVALSQADGKVRFEVNVSVAQQAGLTISSKLLRLASATY